MSDISINQANINLSNQMAIPERKAVKEKETQHSFLRDVVETGAGVTGGAVGAGYGVSRGLIHGMATGVKEGMEAKYSPEVKLLMTAGQSLMLATTAGILFGPVGFVLGGALGVVTGPSGYVGAVIRGAEGAADGIVQGAQHGYHFAKETMSNFLDEIGPKKSHHSS
jgi:hypothetical protein